MNQPPPNEEREARPPLSETNTIAGIQKAFLRLTFWQTLLSLAGVFTGAVALYAALNESQAVRQQTAASVWPYVQFMINDTSDDASASFALSLNNVGVGPARMRSVQLTLAGEPVRDWQSMTAALMGTSPRLGTEYGKASISRRVLAPGESVVAFQTAERELALSMQEAVYSGTARLTYCYCSIFDECWSTSSSLPADAEPIQRVEQCQDYGEASFID